MRLRRVDQRTDGAGSTPDGRLYLLVFVMVVKGRAVQLQRAVEQIGLEAGLIGPKHFRFQRGRRLGTVVGREAARFDALAHVCIKHDFVGWPILESTRAGEAAVVNRLSGCGNQWNNWGA